MRHKGLITAVAVAAVTLGISWSQAPCASACSCVQSTTQDHADMADLVATGTVVDVDRPANPTSSLDDATYTVELTQAWKGEPDATVEVLTAVEGASCGWEGIDAGMEIVLFAQADGATWRSSLCSGTAPAEAATAAELTDLLGAPAEVEDSQPESDLAGLLDNPAVVAGLIVVVVALGIGAWTGRRRAR